MVGESVKSGGLAAAGSEESLHGGKIGGHSPCANFVALRDEICSELREDGYRYSFVHCYFLV